MKCARHGNWTAAASMRLLDLSFTSLAKNLAFDEVLLEMVEAGKGSEVLRFWESPVPALVLGVAQVLREHVREDNCLDDGVRIMRRCSAGGCVLIGPGCLNYSLVLTHERRPEIRTLRGSYCYILERLSEALNMILDVKAQIPELRATDFHHLAACNEVRSMVHDAENFFRASLAREETRGWHIREDYPERDDEEWLKWVLIKDNKGEMEVSYERVPIERYPYKPAHS